MTAILRCLLVPAFVAGLLLAGPAPAAHADVRDAGGYFSKPTIEKANEIIKEIHKDTSKDVVVETFAEAPASRKAALTGANAKKALEEWAADNARDMKLNGVYILLCKDRTLQVEAGPETRKKAFTFADTEKLFGILRDNFKDSKFDDGLLAGLRFTHERMKENLKGVKITPPTGSAEYIRDDGKYFTDNAKRKASEIIADIHKRWGKDVIIETFERKPAGEANMGDWAKRRARDRNANGVYILACKEGKGLQVDAGAETRKKTFTYADTEKLHDLLVADFKKDRFDEGLISGVEFVRDAMKKNLESGAVTPPSSGNIQRGGPTMNHGGGFPWLSLLCPALVIIGVVWLVYGLIRAFTSRSYGPGGPGGGGPGYGYGGGGGGGGFMTGLMGGLFGAMAGSWLYNNMFGGNHGSAFGSSASGSTPSATDDGGTLRSDEGRDFAGTGGSYGDDSGGGGTGDSGGGAGGDYGGDSGGGSGGTMAGSGAARAELRRRGGDFGGGGGDFGGGGETTNALHLRGQVATRLWQVSTCPT